MKNWDAGTLAALLTSHDQVYCVIVWDSTMANVLSAFTSWGTPVYINPGSGDVLCQVAAGLELKPPEDAEDTSLSSLDISIPDPTGLLTAMHIDKDLVGCVVTLHVVAAAEYPRFEVSGAAIPTGVDPELVYMGAIEEVPEVVDRVVKVQLGFVPILSRSMLPPLFSARCRYRTTAECSYAATCAKTYAACKANSQQAHFGGFLYLPPAGFVMEFKDNSTASGRDSGGSNSNNNGYGIING